MTDKDFVVSADGHLLEPTDLFRTRLPKHLRDRGGVGGGLRDRAARRGRRPRSSASCTRRATRAGRSRGTARPAGGCPRATPSMILEDMDLDGVDVQVMHPNLSLFGLYSDDHELSMAHARVYNDYVVERFTPYFDRLAPTAPVPLTDIDDAVAEIERVAAGGFRAILLPAIPPQPYYSRDFDPVWAAAQANGVHVFIHTQTGGVKVNDTESPRRSRSSWSRPTQVNQPMTEKSASKRMITQCVYGTDRPAAGHRAS